MRIELLPNGFVRVDDPSGLVRLWEPVDDVARVRSGNGQPSESEYRAVCRIFDAVARAAMDTYTYDETSGVTDDSLATWYAGAESGL